MRLIKITLISIALFTGPALYANTVLCPKTLTCKGPNQSSCTWSGSDANWGINTFYTLNYQPGTYQLFYAASFDDQEDCDYYFSSGDNEAGQHFVGLNTNGLTVDKTASAAQWHSGSGVDYCPDRNNSNPIDPSICPFKTTA